MNMRWTPPGHRPANDLRSGEGWAAMLLVGGVLVAALLFGGASRQNLLQVSALELASLPLLALAVWRLTMTRGWRAILVPAVLLAVAAAIPLLQLTPLPFDVWAAIPGREDAARALRLAGLDGGWRPLSLAPTETLRHLLALTPPAAVFLGACTLREPDRRTLTLIVPAMAVLSLLVGLAQVAGGADSAFYFYDITNRGSAVGLFANRNHQAALLVVSLPMAALWFGSGRLRGRQALVGMAVLVSIFVVEIVALIVVQSRAGLLLMVPSLLASLAIVWRGAGAAIDRRLALGLGGVVVVALAVGLAFGSGPVMKRFSHAEDRRLSAAPAVANAAWAHLPFGAGVGSFPQVYAAVEPLETMNQTFFNHAHNDYLEIWLDAGWAGGAAVLAFLAWWGSRVLAAWRRGEAGGDGVAQAASVATGLLLAHSAADYPLRTLGMACVFAFALALMTPRPGARRAVSAAR